MVATRRPVAADRASRVLVASGAVCEHLSTTCVVGVGDGGTAGPRDARPMTRTVAVLRQARSKRPLCGAGWPAPTQETDRVLPSTVCERAGGVSQALPRRRSRLCEACSASFRGGVREGRGRDRDDGSSGSGGGKQGGASEVCDPLGARGGGPGGWGGGGWGRRSGPGAIVPQRERIAAFVSGCLRHRGGDKLSAWSSAESRGRGDGKGPLSHFAGPRQLARANRTST